MKTRETIRFLRENTESIYIIHYSCQNLSDSNESYSPRVTSIAVLHIGSDVMHSFSMHLVAETMGIKRDEIRNHYDEIEKRMLQDFYDFVGANNNSLWLHWNMSNINFGFEALIHRYRVLTGNMPPRIEDSKKYNLSELILRRYGKNCVDHPRMTKLMELNGGVHRDMLTGTDEVAAFESKEYVKLHNSTMAKVYWFKKMFFKLTSDKVNTQHSNISHKLNKFLERPVVKLLGFIAILFTLFQLIQTLYGYSNNTSVQQTTSHDQQIAPGKVNTLK